MNESSIQGCAFCGRGGPFTREHIIPESILKRVGADRAGYSNVAGLVHGGDAVIKDVCRGCNSGPLSILDAYAVDLFDKYFAHSVRRGQTVTVNYDFDMLARWLLKVSFNHARTYRGSTRRLARYANYIRDGGPTPTSFRLSLLVVTPVLHDGVLHEPKMVRVFEPKARPRKPTATGTRPALPAAIVTRIVSLFAYYFDIALLPSDAPLDTVTLHPHRVALSPTESSVTAIGSPIDARTVQMPHFVTHFDKWLTYATHADKKRRFPRK